MDLWLASLRALGPRQIGSRLARRFRTRLLYPWLGGLLHPRPAVAPPADLAAADGEQGLFCEARLAPPERAEDLRQRAEDIADHRFAFLNLPPVDLGTPVDWRHAPDGNRLWAYTLHYGEWALTLAHAALSTGERRHLEALIGLVGDWIENNPAGRSPAWDPYPISRRLVAWSRLTQALAGAAVDLPLGPPRPGTPGGAAGRDFWRLTLEPSLRRQARFLAANLEHDVPNNHLLANYRALAWVGLSYDHWPESRRWRRRGLAGLWREMERQVLADGVHFERSISYHAIVLQDLLETWLLARHRGLEPPPAVADTLERMLVFLAATRAPDGSWPMVNDSVPGYPIDPRALLVAGAELFDRPEWSIPGWPRSYAAWLGLEAGDSTAPEATRSTASAVFPDAGCAVLRDDRGGYLFFDAGPMGPASVPGHGHADALSVVVYGGGRPLIVDPGVETYEGGESRDHCRHTRAHSTVEIDGEDPCIFWGPFRVAHPATARLVEWSDDHLLGEHRGYLRRAGVLHRRRVERRVDGWEIVDRFTAARRVGGEHRFAFTLQLAPGGAAAADGAHGAAVWPDGTRLEIRPLAVPPGAVAEVVDRWVSPGWNRRQPAACYVLRWSAGVPCESRIQLRVAER